MMSMDDAKLLASLDDGGGGVHEVPFNALFRATDGFAAARKLGEGAFGEAFLGELSGRTFCVKKLSAAVQLASGEVEDEAEAVARIAHSAAREREVLSRFRHKNIIRLYAVARRDGVHCLVYELGALGSLAEHLLDDAKAAELTWVRRARGALGLAAALNFMYRSGELPVFHRDVKSANIVLADGFVAKLIDCGTSQFVKEDVAAAGAGTVFAASTGFAGFGTPGYMCPSFCQTRMFGEKSELFSFGIVLAELLTGKLQMQDGVNIYDEYEDEEDDLRKALDARPGACPAPVADAHRSMILNSLAASSSAIIKLKGTILNYPLLSLLT